MVCHFSDKPATRVTFYTQKQFINTNCTRGKSNSLHNIIAVKYLSYSLLTISFNSFTS